MYINNLSDIQEYLNSHQSEIVAISVLENIEYTLMNIEFKKDNCIYKAQLSTNEPSQITSIETTHNNINFSFEKFKKILFINRPNRRLMLNFNKAINNINFNMVVSFCLNDVMPMLDNQRTSRHAWNKNIFLTKENDKIYLNMNNNKTIYDFNCSDKEAMDWVIL